MALPLIPAAIIGTALVAGAARVAVTAIGFGVITFIGVDILIDNAMAYIRTSFGQMGIAANFVGLLGLDRAVSIILGAYTTRLSVIPLKKLFQI